MSTTISHERTARTLLNMHLVALHRQGQSKTLAEPTKALQFLMDLPAHDPRLSRLLQEAPLEMPQLREYLLESLEELGQAERRQLVPLLVPVPPNLETSLGYTGQLHAPFTDIVRDARYLGFYWSSSKVYWEDGLGGQTDSWSGYLTWHDHWVVFGALGHYRNKLGSDDGEFATHEWLLDRKTRLIYITPLAVARRVLRGQWPQEAFPDISAEEAVALMKQVHTQMRMPTNEEIMQCYQQEMQQVADLSSWLETYWPMPVFGRGQ
jgi:hypothetical protein